MLPAIIIVTEMESLLDELDEPSKRALKEVKKKTIKNYSLRLQMLMHLLYLVLLSIQFKERVQDCTSKLLDTRDEFYLKWLIGNNLRINLHMHFKNAD